MKFDKILLLLGAWILPQDRSVKARAIPLIATDKKTHEAKQRNGR